MLVQVLDSYKFLEGGMGGYKELCFIGYHWLKLGYNYVYVVWSSVEVQLIDVTTTKARQNKSVSSALIQKWQGCNVINGINFLNSV